MRLLRLLEFGETLALIDPITPVSLVMIVVMAAQGLLTIWSDLKKPGVLTQSSCRGRVMLGCGHKLEWVNMDLRKVPRFSSY